MGGCASNQGYNAIYRSFVNDDRTWSPDGKSGRRYSKREFTKFMFAASSGDIQIVRNFIHLRICGYIPSDLDILDPYGKSALCRATLGGHCEIVRDLIQAGGNWEDSNRFDPMVQSRSARDSADLDSYGKSGNDDAIVDLLHEHESTYFRNCMFISGMHRPHRATILHVAIVMHHVDIVQMILAMTCCVSQTTYSQKFLNRRNTFHQRPVDVAYELNCAECLNQLCRRGADIVDQGTTLLIRAITENKLSLVEALCEGTFNLQRIHQNCPSPLNVAVKLGDVSLVKYLLRSGAQVVTEASYTDMPTILIPVLKCNVPVTKLILSLGLSVEDTFPMSACTSDSTLRNIHDICTRIGQTIHELCMVHDRYSVSSITKLIYIAIFKAQLDLLKLLLDSGANPNYDYRMRNNPSPLLFAVHLNRIEAVRMMLELDDSEVNLTKDDNIFYSLPLISYAAHKKHLEIVRLCFVHGACANEPSVEFLRLPLHIATSGPAPSLGVIKELLEHGASPDLATDLGDSLLHGITREHYRTRSTLYDVILLLLQYGMDLSVQDKYHLTGCWRALVRQDFPTCRLLLEAGSASSKGVIAYLAMNANFIQLEAEQHPFTDLPPETLALHWFQEKLRNPRTLSELCCGFIRKRLGRQLKTAVDHLHLPNQLKDRLLFKHLYYVRELYSTSSAKEVYNHELWLTE